MRTRRQKLAEAPSETELAEVTAALAAVTAALEAGRAPRGRKALREAARLFQAAGRTAEASQALRLLARLEQRRGGNAQALSPARSALRLARRTEPGAEVDASLDLLARLHSRLQEHPQAQRHAEERLARARTADDPAAIADALSRLALVAWSAGDAAGALSHLEEARDAARGAAPAGSGGLEMLTGALLIQCGCPAAAFDLLTRALRAESTGAEQLRTLLVRGWALLCLSRADSAARDFRRARRMARETGDRGLEAQAAAALAVAESRRADGTRALQERSRTLSERASRLSRRLHNPELTAAIEALGAAMAEAPAPTSPKEAATALVDLARRTNSPAAVDACRKEVERLATLPEGAPAYGSALRLPFTLD